MADDLLRNGSGYVDITACKALRNIIREEKRQGVKRPMEYLKGEIFEVETNFSNELREAVIVSADTRNDERYVNVIILNSQRKFDHEIPVACHGIKYADCEKSYTC